MTGPRREVFGDAELWLADWREVAEELRARFPAAVVSDPPYGQAYAPTNRGRHGRREAFAAIEGDRGPFDPRPVLELAPRALLWGAHKFHARLPAGGTWAVWDKRPNGAVKSHGDGEAAWINDEAPRPLRICRHLWDGLCVAAGSKEDHAEGQAHPTQKPVAVMAWSIERLGLPRGSLVADPYMGSGSTGVAALRLGLRFVGVEIAPRHFETACRRIEAAHRAPPLPPELPAALRAATAAPPPGAGPRVAAPPGRLPGSQGRLV